MGRGVSRCGLRLRHGLRCWMGHGLSHLAIRLSQRTGCRPGDLTRPCGGCKPLADIRVPPRAAILLRRVSWGPTAALLRRVWWQMYPGRVLLMWAPPLNACHAWVVYAPRLHTERPRSLCRDVNTLDRG
jgi:hypothetical protein